MFGERQVMLDFYYTYVNVIHVDDLRHIVRDGPVFKKVKTSYWLLYIFLLSLLLLYCFLFILL